MKDKEFLRLEIDKEEARKPQAGFTFCHVRNIEKCHNKISNYVEYVNLISSDLSPFRPRKESKAIGQSNLQLDRIRENILKVTHEDETEEDLASSAAKGFAVHPFIKSEGILIFCRPTPIVFVLEIHNVTK